MHAAVGLIAEQMRKGTSKRDGDGAGEWQSIQREIREQATLLRLCAYQWAHNECLRQIKPSSNATESLLAKWNSVANFLLKFKAASSPFRPEITIELKLKYC